MANQIRYQVGFNVNKSDLNQIKSSLQQLQKVKLDDIMKINKTDINSARDALKSIQEDASKVESALNKAFNTKLNTLNIDKFNKQLSSSNLTIQKVYQSFSRAGTAGQSAFNSLSTQILNTNVQLRQSNKLLDSMAVSMANTVKWGITSSVFKNITGSIQQAYYYAKDLDRSLTDIRIVTGDSADQMQRFATTANNAAKELGRSTLDYTKASLTFYQQGLDDQQVAARTEATLKAQNITGIGTEMADYLTAVWNGFNVGAEEAEGYVDKLAAVADSTASNMGQLATAMSKVASAANSIGVDMDQLNGQVATVIATTRQAPESVGAAFKTIYARINDIKAGTDEAEVSLGNYSGKMAGLGINVLDATGHLRDTGEVIEEIGGKWQSLTREQQINLAQTMAGQRQYNNLIALFDNWDKYLQAVNTSMNAQGTLNEKNDRYLESLEAHMQQLGTQAERTYDILFDENAVKSWVDALDGALGIFNDFISGLGGGTNAFAYFGTTVASIFNKQIAQGIQGVGAEIQRVLANIDAFNTKSKVIEQIKSGLQVQYAGEGTTLGNTALTAQAEAAQKTLAVQKGLTAEQQKQAVQIQKQIGLSQQKVNDLEKQHQKAKDIVTTLQKEQVIQGRSIALLQQDQQRLQSSYDLNQKSLTTMEGMSQSIQKINSGNMTWQQHQQTQRELLQQLDSETENLRDTWIAAGGSSEGFEKHMKNIKEYIAGGNVSTQEFQQSWKSIESVTRTYATNQKADLGKIDLYLKNIGIDTTKLTEEEKRRLSVLLQQNDALAEQGRKTLNLQTLVKGVSAAGMALTSIGGGLSTALADGATAADKLNGRFTAINGTVGALLTMIPGIGPALNIVWQGVSSIGKAILQATGIWQKFEDHFKSAREKIDELNQSISKVNQNDKTKNAQIGNLEAVVEQYERLSEKAGDYGINLNNLTQEQQDRYHQITDSFAQYNKAVIAGYDEQGHAIVRGQDALKDTIQVLKDAKLEADKAALGSKEDVFKGIQAGHSPEQYSDQISDAEKRYNQALRQVQKIVKGNPLESFYENFTSNQLFASGVIPGYEEFINQYGGTLDTLQQKLIDVRDGKEGAFEQALNLQKWLYTQFDRITGRGDLLGDINLLTDPQALQSQLHTALEELEKSKQAWDNIKNKSEEVTNYTQADANYLINALRVFDNQTWAPIEQQLQSMGLGTQSLFSKLAEIITSSDTNTTIEQLYNKILEQSQKYKDLLVNYGQLIKNAQNQAVKDVEQIFSSDDQSVGTINQAIKNSIQQNFLNNDEIQKVLKQHPEYKGFLTELLKDIYNVEDLFIGFDEAGNAILINVKTKGAELRDKMAEALSSSMITKNVDVDGTTQFVKGATKSQLQEYLNQFTDDQIIAINNAIEAQGRVFKTFDEFKRYVEEFNKQVEQTTQIDSIEKNYDRILSTGKKISEGKILTHKEKSNLISDLGLDQKALAQAQKNGNWLQTIMQGINKTYAQGSEERAQAIATLFPSFEELHGALQQDIVDAEDVKNAWSEVYANELNGLNLTEQALKNWAENRKIAFDPENTQDMEGLINSYKISQSANSLQQLAKNVKDAGDQVNTSSEDFIKLQTQLERITGEQWTSDAVINMLDSIAAYTDDGIQKFETYAEWLDYVRNNGPEGTSEKSAASQYKEDKTSVDNLEGASKSLTDKTALSQDQSQALAELLLVNEQLSAIAEEQGINSQAFLEALNAIIEAKNRELEITKEQALQQNRARQQQIQNELEAKNQNGQYYKSIEQRKALQEQLVGLKKEELELQQQISNTEAPEYDADINVQELEHLSDTIQQIAPQSEELANGLAEDEDAANDLAQAILRFDDACKDVADNYEDWMAALNSGSIQDQVQAMDGLRDAYADLLDMDGDSFSQSFLSSAENLDLMRAAIDGDIDAYNQLMDIAQQDIETTVGITLDDTDFWNAKSEVETAMDQMNFENIEIGANLDTGNFLTQLENMVNAAGMTAQQATDYLASMGVDAEVVETTTEDTQNNEVTGYTGQASEVTGTVHFPTVSSSSTEDGVVVQQGEPIDDTWRYDALNVTANPESITAQKQNKAFSLKVTSAHKSSGGGFKFKNATNGGGNKGNARRNSPTKKTGGGKPKGSSPKKTTTKKTTTKKENTSTKDHKKEIEDQRDIYHDINIQIEQIDRNLDRVQKKQDRLYGKELINNLNKQQQLLEKQKKTLAEKLKLQEQDLKNQQSKLHGLGVEFDSEGKISNYMDVLLAKQQQVNAATQTYNDLVDQYNSTTDDATKDALSKEIDAASDNVQNLKDELKDLEDGIKNYDDLREDIQDTVDKVEELTQQQIEIEIKKFRMKVEIHLEMGEAEREWNQFRRKVIERPDYMKSSNFDDIFSGATQDTRDISSYFNVNNSGTGSIETLTNQLLETKKQIEDIDRTGTSAIYGDNKELAMQHLQNDLKQLMTQLENVEDLIDNIDKAYLETIDDIQKNFDKQIEDYQFVGDLIDHDIDLLTILYGDKNYDAMDNYYTTLERNNNNTLDSLKKQADWWKKQWDAAKAAGDTKAAEKFEAAYKKTIKSLNSQIQESAKIIQQKYENAINKIFDTLDKKISGGKGTDYLSMEWELMNKNEEQYLDTINSAFAIQQTQRKYNRALNETKSIKNQQALKKLMDEQLSILKNKNKLTQYDIDRAEKLLQIEQARIALEQTRSSKTSMRLKRDSQGNYSYQYMADQGAIGDAEQNLAKAQNDLYNFDKEAYKQNLEDMLSAWQDYLSRRKEILLDNNLTEAQQKEKLALLDEQYGEYINGKTEQNLSIRTNLTESAFKDIAAIYNTDVGNYQQMANDEINILMTQLVPMWDSGIQHMSDQVAGEGGFIPTCQSAFRDIQIATANYEDELDSMANSAGIDLGQVKSGVDELATEFETLVENNDDLIDRMDQQLTAIGALRTEAQGLVTDYGDVKDAAVAAATQIQSYMQTQREAAAVATETAQIIEDTQNDSSTPSTTDSGTRTTRNNNVITTVFTETVPKKRTSNNGGSSNNGGGSNYTSSTPAIITTTKKKATTPYSPPYKTTPTYIPGRGMAYSTKTGPGTRKIIKKTGKKFDTGGYTGDWNSNEGRLAVLHQKELVLNKTDTENFLSGVAILREINSSLNGNMFSMLNNLSSNRGFDASGDILEQNVHIDASFPNVNSKKEIEEAFNELVNMAAQRAMRR